MQVYHLVTGLNKKGSYKPVVVSMIDPGHVGNLLKQANIPVYSLQMHRGKPGLAAIWRLNQLIRKEKIQIFHTHMFHAILLGRLMKFMNSRLKVVSTIHSINIGGKQREVLLRLTDRLSDINTIISEVARDHLINAGAVPKKRIRMIPNGVNTRLFAPESRTRARKRKELGVEDEFVWLAVGRFEEVKNYPNLLQAFKKVRDVYTNTKLYLVGAGPLLEAMQRLAARLGMGECIRFLGLREDIPELMNAADAYVLSSNWEGLPLVLLEAASTGLPVVATNVGGNREIVQHNETGYLVPTGSPEALANQMVELMGLSGELRLGMGQRARDYILSKYDLGKVVDEWEKVYANLGDY